MKSVDECNFEIQWVIDSTQKLHDAGRIRGIVVTVVTQEGGFSIAKSLNLVSLIEMIGALEASKDRLLENTRVDEFSV